MAADAFAAAHGAGRAYDKPLGLDPADAERAVSACRDAGVKLEWTLGSPIAESVPSRRHVQVAA